MKHKLIGILAAVALVSKLSAQSVDTVVATNLSEPFGVVADGAGVIYITDAANNRIEKFNVTTSVKTTLAGMAGQVGSANGIGSQARFWYPQGLVAARGGLVVADSGNHTIRFVGLNGAVSNIAGQVGVFGQANGTGTNAQFGNPLGLATDTNGNIFIADSLNDRIQKLAPNDAVTTAVIGGLYEPAGVAVGDNGDLWVADTRHHVIKRFNSSGTLILTAGLSGSSGTNDSDVASGARFNSPRGLLWMGGNSGLLISDSGNNTIRRLYPNPDNGNFKVETQAGTPGQSGFVNGVPSASKFNSPISLCRDPINGGFLIVDRANNAVRRLQTSAPLPPVSAPTIGIVTFPPPQFLSVLLPTTASVFNNDVIIAVLAESGTETFFTFGPTPPSTFEDTIPVPSANTGSSPPPYQNGMTAAQVNPSMVAPQPDMTIKVIGTQDGRQSSPVIQARFQFKTANPTVDGDNAASFVLNNITTDAQMWYTVDGSDPTNSLIANPAVIGPVDSGIKISLVISNNVTFKARAYRFNYKPSEIAVKLFSPTNFVANRISFGFENGEASSEFVASAGQKFYAPVTLTILPNQTMYSLQFNVTVTNLNATTNVAAGAVGFQSMLVEKTDQVFRTIPPAMVASFSTTIFTNVVGSVTNYITNSISSLTNLLFTNSLTDNLLGVGWLARSDIPETYPNLFNVKNQDLITYSIAKDTLFTKANSKIVVGAYSFDVPLSALVGDTYSIKISRPSATTDGYGAPGSDVYIESPTQGSLTNGPINGLKTVTVGNRKYVVGDVYPFKWLNAGDFGDTNLVSADVAQVFQTATYGFNAAKPGSDLADAMDSCCYTAITNSDLLLQSSGSSGDDSMLFNGNDLLINSFVFGDGTLDVRDVFVTFRRSLDPSLTWYRRFWFNGNRVAETNANLFNGTPDQNPAATSNHAVTAADGPIASPFINFTIGDVSGTPGQTVSVPIQAQILGNYPVRVLQFNVTVQALDGSPAITNAVQFIPASGLGQPTFPMSSGPNNYAAAWLNNGIAGLSGTTNIGTLLVKIPASANAASGYRIHFDHISASPNGLARFDQRTQDGLLLLANRDTSSWSDGIPDTWRLRYFGSLGNVLSQASADADGDKVSNWAEYKAGTDPNDVSSFLHMLNTKKAAGLVVRWPSVANKTYVIESSPALFGAEWTVISTNIVGNGQELEFTDSTSITGSRFYRIRVKD